ncbi:MULTISPECIES: hypothetical protein [unclassified Rathayibacter]|uniref:hypothetical protein n=1 Tax=unclassified Rathayibacter TaxID=2609250 RepID=UPI0012E8E9B3|nr:MULTISPECIES: hypothetical protein [unclassified Rathayibacter]
MQEVVDHRRRNSDDAYDDLRSLDEEDRAARAHARENVVRAEQALEGALRVQSTVEAILGEAERAVTTHTRSVEQIVASALGVLRSTHSDLEVYLQAHYASGGSGPAADSTPSTSSTLASPSLPNGVRMVALSDIDDSDSRIVGGQDFGKGYSPQDLEWALNAFVDVVVPTVAAGGTIDDLRARDAAEGRMGTRSYSDTYSGFLDGDAIKLDGVSGSFEVKNGYHRIWVARRMGLDSIPARVNDGG